MVLNKHGDRLYEGAADTIRRHLLEVANVVSATPSEGLLPALATAWADHKITLGMIKDILMYMERTYVPSNKKVPIYILGLQIFRNVIIHHTQVRDRLRQILLDNIGSERNGCIIDRSLMKSILSMLSELGVEGVNIYEEDFEVHFLEDTRNFYRAESLKFLSEATCPDYVKKAESRLAEETARVQGYLSHATELKLKHVVETELITVHAKALVEMEGSGCACMMADNKLEDLKRMFSLFSRVPSTLDHIRECMSDCVKKTGASIISDQDKVKDPVAFVQQLLDLKAKYDDIVDNCFKGEKRSLKRLKEAFEDFVNKDTRCASYLSSYIDEQLRNGLKGASETDAESKLDKAIVIFRFIYDKDIFENFYKIHLSKRLLGGLSYSDETERAMISKLKSECGYQFTNKLEGMFTDMKMSKSIMEDFRLQKIELPFELDVRVLTTGAWPTTAVVMCKFPAMVQDVCNKFGSYYLEKHSGRKLTWLTHLGTADVRARFRGGDRKELTVSTYQMLILMLFNDQRSLTFSQIKEASQISDVQELKRHLLSLCTQKFKILNKSSATRVRWDSEFVYCILQY